MAEGKEIPEAETIKESSPPVVKKKGKGVISRVWNAILRTHGDDFEKRLQHISKEETAVLARMKRRSQTWRRMIRQIIFFSVILEVIAIIYAIMTTRSMEEMDWKMRVFRILPMFLLPLVSSVAYSAFVRVTRICERRDQKTLDRLRAERQAKIDELKEKTNYYTTQQLIQRYDPDPAAKAAAATVLASKLGADSGLKVYVGDESTSDAPVANSNDVEVVPSTGLRKRKQLHSRSSSAGSTQLVQSNEDNLHSPENVGAQASEHGQLVVDHHYPQGPSTTNDGGWLARIAALLVGEDPTQSYALICGNCHMHNGLARKEDFPYITYYCPHCHVLNRPKQENISRSDSPQMNPLKTEGTGDAIKNSILTMSDSLQTSNNPGDAEKNSSDTMSGSVLTNDKPVRAGSEIEEESEKVESRDLVG